MKMKKKKMWGFQINNLSLQNTKNSSSKILSEKENKLKSNGNKIHKLKMNIGKSKMAKRCWPTMEAEVANYSKFIFRIWNDRTSHTIGSTRTAWHHPKIRNLRMEMMRHITSKKSRRGIIIHKRIRIMIKFSMNRWWIQWIRNQMRQNSVYRKRW